jgi:general stress protein YciG
MPASQIVSMQITKHCVCIDVAKNEVPVLELQAKMSEGSSSNRGFAAMPKEKVQEIASKGGRSRGEKSEGNRRENSTNERNQVGTEDSDEDATPRPYDLRSKGNDDLADGLQGDDM